MADGIFLQRSFCIVGIAIDTAGLLDAFSNGNDRFDRFDCSGFVKKHLKGCDFHEGLARYGEDTWIVGKELRRAKEGQCLDDFENDVFLLLKRNGYNGTKSSIGVWFDAG